MKDERSLSSHKDHFCLWFYKTFAYKITISNQSDVFWAKVIYFVLKTSILLLKLTTEWSVVVKFILHLDGFLDCKPFNQNYALSVCKTSQMRKDYFGKQIIFCKVGRLHLLLLSRNNYCMHWHFWQLCRNILIKWNINAFRWSLMK